MIQFRLKRSTTPEELAKCDQLWSVLDKLLFKAFLKTKLQLSLLMLLQHLSTNGSDKETSCSREATILCSKV